MIPDLTSYDVLLLNTSAGKDSQAMLDYVVELADAAGVRDRIVAVHADLGKMEWPGTKSLAERQVEHYGLRFEVVTRRTKDGIVQNLLEQVEDRGMWPDNARRYCTSDHKRGPILTAITMLVAEMRLQNPNKRYRVLNMMGLRAQESPRRALTPPFENNAKASNGRRHVDNWLPIHTWSEDEVWARIWASGVESHPAYRLGMPRLSCRFCILASKPALVLSAQLNPELAQEYLEVEQRIGHTFKKDLPMAEIIRLAAESPRVEQIESWVA